MKRKNLNFRDKVQIVCPFNFGTFKVLRYIYYSKYAWRFTEVKIVNKYEEDNFNTLLIDRNSLDNFEISKSLKKYKIFICLWNGVLDLYDSKVTSFEEKLKKLKIKYNFFIVGYNKKYIRNKKFYFINDKLEENTYVKIKCNYKYKFNFFFPNIYYLLKIYQNFSNFKKYFFGKPKLIFVGGGILNDEYVKNKFSKKKEEQYLVIDQFYSYFKNNGLDRSNKYFKKLLTSKKFKNLPDHWKLYVFQRISRHILLSNLDGFENFKFILREFNLGLLNSTIFSKHFFLDFGSSAGFGLYDRSMILFKNHRLRTVNVDFFKKKLNFIKSFKKFEKLNNKILNCGDKSIEAKYLINLMK
tara:strand:- start:484 stop:1548 length:1065 start_codon:yes stop_codon:yes gene_type:complete